MVERTMKERQFLFCFMHRFKNIEINELLHAPQTKHEQILDTGFV